MDTHAVDEGRLVSEVVRLYAQGLPLRQVGQALGVSTDRVHRIVRAQGVCRSRTEGIRRAKNRTVPMTPELRSLVDGLLLGDGHLTPSRSEGKRGESSLILRQTEAHSEWVVAVQKALGNCGIQSTISKQPARTVVLANGKPLRMKPSLRLRTQSLRVMSDERSRWYPSGIKAVPVDVALDEEAVVQWFLGDGSNSQRLMKFATNCFAVEDVQRLAAALSTTYGWSPKVRLDRGLPILVLTHVADIDRLRALVRSRAPDCFRRKWENVWGGRRIKPRSEWAF